MPAWAGCSEGSPAWRRRGWRSQGEPQGGAPTTQPAADLNTGVSGIGVVKPAQDANLTFAVQGTVDKVLVKEGDLVKQGQLLAILDVRTFDEQVGSAEAALEIAQ